MAQKAKRGIIGQLMPAMLKNLLEAKSVEFVRQIGVDVLRQVVFDVMCGRNLRDATEMLTRRRIALVNAALVVLFMQGLKHRSDFISCLADIVSDELRQKSPKTERWVLQWLLGLTDKAAQNVLRDDFAALETYRERYMQVCREIVSECERNFGAIKGNLGIEKMRSGCKLTGSFFTTYLMPLEQAHWQFVGLRNRFTVNFLSDLFWAQRFMSWASGLLTRKARKSGSEYFGCHPVPKGEKATQQRLFAMASVFGLILALLGVATQK